MPTGPGNRKHGMGALHTLHPHRGYRHTVCLSVQVRSFDDVQGEERMHRNAHRRSIRERGPYVTCSIASGLAFRAVWQDRSSPAPALAQSHTGACTQPFRAIMVAQGGGIQHLEWKTMVQQLHMPPMKTGVQDSLAAAQSCVVISQHHSWQCLSLWGKKSAGGFLASNIRYDC